MRDPDRAEHVYAEALHRLLCGEIGRTDPRFGGADVVDEHVEPPVLAPDPFGGCRGACVARGFDFDEDSPEFAGRPQPTPSTARCIQQVCQIG